MHFYQKKEGVQKMVFDLEFKRFKTKEIREDVRKEYDNHKQRIFNLEEQIKTWPLDKDQGDKARLEDEVLRLNENVKRYEAQMKQLDDEVEGRKPSQEDHDGVTGINEQIDSLKELEGMLDDWIKRI